MRTEPWKAPREPHHVPPPPPPHHHPGGLIPPHVAIMDGLEIVSQQLADLSQQVSELQAMAGVRNDEAADLMNG